MASKSAALIGFEGIYTCGMTYGKSHSIECLLEVLASIPIDPLSYKKPEDCYKEEPGIGTFFHADFHTVAFPFLFTIKDNELTNVLKKAIADNMASEKYKCAIIYRQMAAEEAAALGKLRSKQNGEVRHLLDELNGLGRGGRGVYEQPEMIALQQKHERDETELYSKRGAFQKVALADMYGLGYTHWVAKITGRVEEKGLPVFAG